jgi:hypothetical protein
MTPSATSSHLKGYQGQSPWLVSTKRLFNAELFVGVSSASPRVNSIQSLPAAPAHTRAMRMRISGLAGELYPYTIQKRLCPLLPNFVEASLLKIIWSHDDSEFDTRVESQKPGLGKGGNL